MRSYLTTDTSRTLSLRRDQLIQVNKVVNEKEQLEKGWRRRRRQKIIKLT
jgi:hypothetical protein